MKKLLCTYTVIILFTALNLNHSPVDDYVPDEKTAIKVAEAIWLPIYGDGVLDKKPFKATQSDDGKVWIVKGTVPKGMLGGYPIAEIRKSDCKILRVSRSK